jgi:hypothetical protein
MCLRTASWSDLIMKLSLFLQRLRGIGPQRSSKLPLALMAACVFAFGMAFSFGTAADDGSCNYECDRYCFSQFMWCGGFFNDHCYPEYVACTQACGCLIGG